MKKIFAILITLCLLLSALSLNAFAIGKAVEEPVYPEIKSGTWGDCTWERPGNGDEMIISGNGKFPDFTGVSSPPWGRDMKKVTVKNGVTYIGARVFERCFDIKTVSLPNSLNEIGHDAFRSCMSIESIDLGSSITTIGAQAFMGCYNLDSVTVPITLKTVVGGAFGGHCVKDVYYPGTYRQKNEIEFNYSNEGFENAKWHYPCEKTGHQPYDGDDHIIDGKHHFICCICGEEIVVDDMTPYIGKTTSTAATSGTKAPTSTAATSGTKAPTSTAATSGTKAPASEPASSDIGTSSAPGTSSEPASLPDPSSEINLEANAVPKKTVLPYILIGVGVAAIAAAAVIVIIKSKKKQ